MVSLSSSPWHFKTNKIISKFIPGILSECTFCNLSTESILHLLWKYQVTKTFINDVYALFINKWKEIRAIPDMKSFCFGQTSTVMHTPENILALYVKYFIWICRCKNAFLSWFRIELKINHMAYGSDNGLAYLSNNVYRMEMILDIFSILYFSVHFHTKILHCNNCIF